MNSSAFDLAYELQHEFAWDSAFAAAATNEYMRWLRLRAKAFDFEACKYPPSRVVAMVWNLHRQWTFHYANTCATLGGFIHHFPPAMRVNLAMEQAYSATLHMYRAHFKQDPPLQYWGPSFAAIPDPLEHHPAPHPASPRSLRANKRDAKPSKPSSSTTHPTHPTSAPQSTATTSTATATVTPAPLPSPPVLDKALVLRPLAPGEKRRRGRPSASEYIPVSYLPTSTTPHSNKPSRPVGRPRKNPHTFKQQPSARITHPSPDQNFNNLVPTHRTAPRKTNPTPMAIHNVMTSAVSLPQVPTKRPRGRPRKDGTWPRPRVGLTTSTSIAVPPVSKVPPTPVSAAPTSTSFPSTSAALHSIGTEETAPVPANAASHLSLDSLIARAGTSRVSAPVPTPGVHHKTSVAHTPTDAPKPDGPMGPVDTTDSPITDTAMPPAGVTDVLPAANM